MADTALAIAREKADDRGIEVEFAAADTFELERLDGPDTGPHPVSQEELRTAFNPSNGWDVAAIELDRIQTRYHDDGAPAWLATIKRI